MIFKLNYIFAVIASVAIFGCTNNIHESESNESTDTTSSAAVATTYDVLMSKPTSSTGSTKVAQYEAKYYIFQNPYDTKQLEINNVPVTGSCTSTSACKVSTSNIASLSQSGYVIEVYIDGADVGSSTANGNPAFLINTTMPRSSCPNVGLNTVAGSTNAGYEVNYWGRQKALTGGGALAYKIWNGVSWVNAKFRKNVLTGKYTWAPASSSDPQSASASTSYCD